ncbi:MAG TPA: protein kinase [Gemmatimonadaceae bacterium]|nr:protein kinase [Gemmatimonadaceae bacterium]
MDASIATSTAPVEEVQGDPLRDALVDAVGDSYEIVRLIGRGGMGAVYLARDRALERLVAIKVLPPGSATDAGVLERFRREAKTVASLQHVGIVPLYAFGERRGLCWFVMGYVRGESLASRIERETVLDVETVRTLLAQVAEALDHAHRQGIVHRDIKPDNILLDDTTGRAMLTDFGIARADALQAGTSLTQVGSVMGTPHYMSPEQATAEPGIDGRSDLYSVGVVGYQLLSGTLPFDGRSFRELLMQHVSAAPKPLSAVAPSVPTDLSEAVMRCLEKEPAKRFSDGRSLRAAVGGSAYNDETLSYELAELQNTVATSVMVVLVCATLVLCAMLRGGTLLSVPGWLWFTPVLAMPLQWFKVREAQKRGYEWSTIRRVMTLPPRWWWLWWPRSWRRTGDVHDQLPPVLKSARLMTSVMTILVLLEMPLVAWATDPRRLAIRERIPGAHAYFSMRWLANVDGIVPLSALVLFLLVLVTSALVADFLSRRATKGLGVSYMDRQRLSYKPTDSAFWRDPRIQAIYRRQQVDRRPRTPQEFVSQILAAAGTLPPSVTDTGNSATTAARRLLDAMAAHERELALLEKAAPREQLERLEAEIVLHESEAGDPEAVALLVNQRDALLRSRERMLLVTSRRDEAAARLESLWADVRRLATTTDADAARTAATSINARCKDVERDYPVRRSATSTQRTTGARLGMAAAVTATLFVQVPPVAPSGDAAAFLARGQPDSALAILSTRRDTSVELLVQSGQAHLQLGNRRGIASRIRSARRARAAFAAAYRRDSTRADVLEPLAWMYRLLPRMVGGDRVEARRMLAELERFNPYRGALLRGHFARADGHDVLADSIYRALTTAHVDSAPAFFALYDLAYRRGKADVARAALQRYVTLMPDDRAALFHRGLLAAVHGVDLNEGQAALREFIKGPILLTQPTVDVAWWRLGQVLAKSGQVADARSAYRKAIALDRRDRDFRASLTQLDASVENP